MTDRRIADVTDLAADLAAAYGTTPEQAVETMRRAIILTVPLATCGIIVAFRWWERPRRLWARRATTRAVEDLYLTLGEQAP